MNKIIVEVSIGELLDKISILEIKQEKIKDPEKLKFIKNEYSILKDQLEKKNNEGIKAITKTDIEAIIVSRLVAHVILLISCLTCLTNCAGFVLAISSLSCKNKMIYYFFFCNLSK